MPPPDARAGQPAQNRVLWFGPGEFERFRDHWSALQEQENSSPMARWEWTLAYLDTYARDSRDKAQIAALFVAGRLAAVLPFMQKQAVGQAYLEMMSSQEIYEPTNALSADDESLTQLLDAVLRERGQPIVFHRHRRDAAFSGDAMAALREAFKVRRRLRPYCPSAPIDGDPERLLSAGRRSDLRRMMRRAQKWGEVRFEILSPSAEEAPALLERAMTIEASGWKGRSRSSLTHDEGERQFFARYAVLAAQAGILRLCFMFIGERAVATQIAAQCGGALWLLKVGYDEAYAACSPGNLLMREVLAHAGAQGLKSCEFLGFATDWTRMWTRSEHPTEAVTLFPSRWSYLRHLPAMVARRLHWEIVLRLGLVENPVMSPTS